MWALEHHGILCRQTACCVMLELAVHHGQLRFDSEEGCRLPLCAPRPSAKRNSVTSTSDGARLRFSKPDPFLSLPLIMDAAMFDVYRTISYYEVQVQLNYKAPLTN